MNRFSKSVAVTLAVPLAVLTALLAPGSASGATTTRYSGTLEGDVNTDFSFRVVAKKQGRRTVRTVKGVSFENLPVFCGDGALTTSNGLVRAEPKVAPDRRFQGTSYTETGDGSIALEHVRGAFSANRSFASGRLSATIRFVGGKECSSGFVDWAADRLEPN